MPKPTLVAVDTNILLRLAGGDEAIIDACELIRRRMRPVQFLILPTVLDELGAKASQADDPAIAQLAIKAISKSRSDFGFFALDTNSVQEALITNAARTLRDAGLLPPEERNDAFIIAESSVMKCVLLVSRDSHILGIDRERMTYHFRVLDLPVPLITSPEDLLRKFYR
jgi:hypothetical protein